MQNSEHRKGPCCCLTSRSTCATLQPSLAARHSTCLHVSRTGAFTALSGRDQAVSLPATCKQNPLPCCQASHALQWRVSIELAGCTAQAFVLASGIQASESQEHAHADMPVE